MSLSTALTATLEQVHITGELQDRPTQSPSDVRLDEAILRLNTQLSRSPKDVLQLLASTALTLCNAHTVGISLLEHEDGRALFRWRAMAGRLAGAVNLAMARDDSPCGMVLDTRASMLFTYPEKHFPFPAPVEPSIVEVLLVPFFDHAEPVGTIWVVSHDEDRKFNAEDSRIVGELCHFASSAYGQLSALGYVQDLRARRAARDAPRTRKRHLAVVPGKPSMYPSKTVHTDVAGSYQRRQGSRKTYTYVGTYSVNSEGTWWSIAVRCGGNLTGMPLGSVAGLTLPSRTQIVARIESQIEDLDQIRE